MYRIAAATSDGIVVNQHFGHASQFVILDVTEKGETHWVETRIVEPVCQFRNHDESKLEEAIKKLSDCDYLLVSRIGEGASSVLDQYNITAFMLPGVLEESVQKLIAYVEIQELILG